MLCFRDKAQSIQNIYESIMNNNKKTIPGLFKYQAEHGFKEKVKTHIPPSLCSAYFSEIVARTN